MLARLGSLCHCACQVDGRGSFYWFDVLFGGEFGLSLRSSNEFQGSVAKSIGYLIYLTLPITPMVVLRTVMCPTISLC